MFCEDAARRLAAAVLAANPRVVAWSARVAHFEKACTRTMRWPA
ncbi:MAG: hypothetical protein U1F19_03025 [Lysobacterales bacterium]